MEPKKLPREFKGKDGITYQKIYKYNSLYLFRLINNGNIIGYQCFNAITIPRWKHRVNGKIVVRAERHVYLFREGVTEYHIAIAKFIETIGRSAFYALSKEKGVVQF